MSTTVYKFPALPGIAMSVGPRAAIIESRAQTERALAIGRVFAALFRGVWNLFGRVDTSIRSAHAMRELFMMNDRALADIGISRSDIPSVIAGSDFDNGIETAVAHYLYTASGNGIRDKHLAA